MTLLEYVTIQIPNCERDRWMSAKECFAVVPSPTPFVWVMHTAW